MSDIRADSAARAASAARGFTALVLLALLWFGVRTDRGPEAPTLVTAETPPGALAAELASARRGPVVYDDSVPPTRIVAGLLGAGASRGRAVTLRTPGSLPALSVVPPPFDPVARRRTALTVTVRGAADDTVHLSLQDGSGHTDTLSVIVGPTGSATTRVAIEPARTGIERWTVRAGPAEATSTVWVRPAAPVRVLLMSGPPTWETRYLVRALEGSGSDVVVQQDLGRALLVSSSGIGRPSTREDLVPYDVVVWAPGASSDPRAGPGTVPALLEAWVREAGGGLLVLEGTGDEDRRRPARDLVWSGPAEIAPLPALEIDAAGTQVDMREGETSVVGPLDDPSATFVVAGTLGRGRTVRSALETWPWVLDGGAADAHAVFWSSVAEWLAGGLTGDLVVTGSGAQPFTVWEGRFEGVVPASLRVRRAGNAGESLIQDEELTVVGAGEGRGIVRFVPSAPGPHALRRAPTNPGPDGPDTRVGDPPLETDESEPLAVVVVADPDERLSWVDAALEVGGPGGLVAPAGLGGETATSPLGARRGFDWVLFLALAAVMSAGWAIRRIGGLV